MNKEISPSLLAADILRLPQTLPALEQAGCKYLHLDIMDGHFVPNISFGAAWVKQLRPASQMLFDVHLMVEEPDWLIERFKEAGSDLCSVHAEAVRHLDRTLHLIRDLGMRPGVAINPATPISQLRYILPLVDIVIVMGVNPGYSYQKFIPYTMDKLRELAALRAELGLDFLIEMDGGAGVDNAAALCEAGADILVAGGAVFGKPDPAAAFKQLYAAMNGK